ncbi:FliH/SctL family protein [Agaribacter flavus]|uniref:Flagellar assembly protein FliH/Type III secretion system HrpE domain-containing protein n=1 Tax=Agaribacter flavus TaxID=1902781 RepID=A0ABV7FSV0_9ALTE
MANGAMSIKGSVQSFIPGLVNNSEPLVPEVKLEVDRLKETKRALFELSSMQRTALLDELFFDDIEVLKKQAHEEAYAHALEEAKGKQEKKLESKLNTLDEHIEAFSSVIDNIKASDKWEIPDENLIKEVVLKSVLHITSDMLDLPENNVEIFNRVLRTHISEKPKILYIPSGLHTLLERLNKLDAMADKIEIQPDPSLEKGSFRLELQKSGIEYSLKNTLAEYTSILVETNIQLDGE